MHASLIVSIGCAGFLLGALWMDLMFDVQVLRHRRRELPEVVLASIATYYARVTTSAAPMGRLIALTMLTLLVALGFELVETHGALVSTWAAFGLAVIPIGLAAMRTVPNAVRLGRRADDAAHQRALARAICFDHVFCFAAMLTFVAVRIAGDIGTQLPPS